MTRKKWSNRKGLWPLSFFELEHDYQIKPTLRLAGSFEQRAASSPGPSADARPWIRLPALIARHYPKAPPRHLLLHRIPKAGNGWLLGHRQGLLSSILILPDHAEKWRFFRVSQHQPRLGCRGVASMAAPRAQCWQKYPKRRSRYCPRA